MSRPVDNKFQFLINKLENYLSFFFFYKAPYKSIDSIKPFKNFLKIEVLNKVVQSIAEQYSLKRNNVVAFEAIQVVCEFIIHFSNLVERLSVGYRSYAEPIFQDIQKVLTINYTRAQVVDQKLRINDNSLFGEFVNNFSQDQHFETKEDMFRWFNEDGLTELMIKQKVSCIYR